MSKKKKNKNHLKSIEQKSQNLDFIQYKNISSNNPESTISSEIIPQPLLEPQKSDKLPYLFSICISTLAKGEFLIECLESIESTRVFAYEQYCEPPYEVVVLIDGKEYNQNIYNKLKAHAVKYPHVKILEHDKFDSLSKAWNYTIKNSTGKFVVVLNDDTVVHDKWLDLFYHGWFQISRDAGMQEQKVLPGIIFPTISKAHLKTNVREAPVGDQGKIVHLTRFREYPAGVCIFTSREVLEKIKYFDESFLDYSAEDADLCYKIWDAGMDLFVDERIWIKHIHSASVEDTEEKKKKKGEIYKRNGQQFIDKWAKYLKKTLPAPSKIVKHIDFNELVSIVMPVKDGARFIQHAIVSIQKNSYKNLEILVLDCGSTDNTSAIISKMAESDSRIRLIRDQEMTYAQAFRKTFDLAKGEYIAQLQVDDTIHETCIEKCVAKLRLEPTASFVYTNQIACDGKHVPIGQSERTKTMYSQLMLVCNFMVSDFRMFRKSIYDIIAKDWNMIGNWMPDYDLILRMSELDNHPVLFIDEFLHWKKFRPDGMHAKYCLEQLLDMKHCAEAALNRRGLTSEGYYLTHEATLKSNLHKGNSATAACKQNRNTPEVWSKILELCKEKKRSMFIRPDGRTKIDEMKKMVETINVTDRILDLGCGNGELIFMLKDKGVPASNLCGIDFAVGGDVLKKDIQQKDWFNGKDKQFDVIFLTHVIQHLEKPQKTMIYITNYLKDNGRLIVSIPSEMDNRYDVEGLNINFWRNAEEVEGWFNTFDFDVINKTKEWGVAGSLCYELIRRPRRSCNVEYLQKCKENADITVFMPMYNREKFIRQAIRGMQSQTYENFILKVYDDFSEDNGCAIVEEMMKTDPRIELIKMPKKTGITPLYPIMYDTANTKYFCQVDSDDYIAPKTFELTRNFLESKEETTGVGFTDYISMADNEKLSAVGDRTRMSFSMENILEYFMTFQFRLQRVSAFRAMSKINWPTPGSNAGPDYELSVRLSEVTHFERVPYPCYYYRQHGGTINSNRKDDQRKSSYLIIEEARKRRALKYKV
jgi:glycosyltransferase involved in cell wall biosynthesis